MEARGVHWLASYPKSGNTWVRIALACLVNGGRLPDLSRAAGLCPNSAALGWMEDMLDLPLGHMTPTEQSLMRTEACRLYAETTPGPAFLKVHDAYSASLFAPVSCAGTVLIVRDPRDVAPSWADHMGVELDDAIKAMGGAHFAMGLAGMHQSSHSLQRLESWSANVQSWLDAPGAKLLLRYEDMLAEPAASLTALARFTGLPVNAALVEDAVTATSFQSLRAAEAQQGFRERVRDQKKFFRQGRSGAWKQSLSPMQIDRLWSDHHKMMARLGYGEDGTLSTPSP
ncbi:sulfotransferase domain-containing protein [Rhizorhabdus sp. FW153]|uniref:sulfotransferase domain-containing protein n=1 Tax=Rhizorhabdus sp. FW153 TaxID=3400216 RepID=UPI003CF262E4